MNDYLMFKIDHPIHPPRTETDPFDCQVLEDCGYKTNIYKGVFKVVLKEIKFRWLVENIYFSICQKL